MQAVILAGGRGTRMGHLTKDRPKPLVEVNGVAIIEHQLAQLQRHGITDVAVYESYRARSLQRHLGDGSRFGMNIEHRVKDFKIGSAGCVKDALLQLPETDRGALLIFGDILADIDYTALVEQHMVKGPYLTVVHTEDRSNFGELTFGKGNTVTGFQEKRTTYPASGIYLVNRRLALDEPIPDKGDFSHDVMTPLIKAQLRTVEGFKHNGYWEDLASPDVIIRVESSIEAGRLTLYQGSEGNQFGFSLPSKER